MAVFENKICLHPQFVVLLPKGRASGAGLGQRLLEWRTDQHTANAHGNERTFLDVEVAVKADGTLTRVQRQRRSGPLAQHSRSTEPLGSIIWAQVTPGCDQ